MWKNCLLTDHDLVQLYSQPRKIFENSYCNTSIMPSFTGRCETLTLKTFHDRSIHMYLCLRRRSFHFFLFGKKSKLTQHETNFGFPCVKKTHMVVIEKYYKVNKIRSVELENRYAPHIFWWEFHHFMRPLPKGGASGSTVSPPPPPAIRVRICKYVPVHPSRWQ